MTTSPDQLLGVVLDGRYRLDSILAKGGMATVFFAADLRLKRQVAVKVMHASLAEDADFVRRFEHEARAAASLTHQHVVSVHDQGNDASSNAIYLVMELVPGHTVRELLGERGPLTAIQALAVMDPVLQALSAAHEAGFVHRDIKPENIIIGDNGRIKVTDFGLARAITTTQSMATTRGMLIGTVAYLSPEQVEQGKADERSDIYSAGVVLYEMLTGKLPHAGETPIAVAFQHVHADIPKPSSIDSNVPTEMDYLVLRATARDPRRRFTTAEEFLDAVRKTRNYLETGSAHKLPPIVEMETQTDEQRTVVIDIPDSEYEDLNQIHETLVIRKPKKFKKLVAIFVLIAVIVGGYTIYSGTQTKVPQLVGLTQAQALESLANAELTVEIKEVFSEVVPKGVVISADPSSGNGIAKNSQVSIVISKGPEYFTVPNLQNMTVDQAQAALKSAGLGLGATSFAYSDEIKKNHVISANPAIGELAKPKTLVSLVLSKGKAPVAIPSVVGTTESSATSLLNGLGFNNLTIVKEYSNSVATGNVISQTPDVGLEVLTKTQITLVVSKGIKPVTVPNILGMTKGNAISTLETAKLTYKIIGQTTCSNGYKKNSRKISQQSITAGNKVPPGTEVGFVIAAKCK